MATQKSGNRQIILLIGGGIAAFFILPRLFSGGGGGGTNVHLKLSQDTAKQGDIVGIAVDGLKPSTNLIYGWKEIGFQQQYVSLPSGEWYGPPDLPSGGGIVISAAPGTYTIYIDQRSWGGPYYETKLTIVAGDTPAPTTYGHIHAFAQDSSYVLSPDEPFKFHVQLYDGSDKAPISGVQIKFLWNGNVFDQVLTNSSGLASTRSTSGNRGALFGLGTHTIYAIAPKKDSYGSPIQDSFEIAVTS